MSSQTQRQSTAMDGYESILRFLLLPSQVGLVLLLEFLNSFRSFGLRFVQYSYITNEFGIGDSKAGTLLGVKGIVDIIFGLMGSILVDIFGVRRVSIVALSVAIVGRSLLAFGRTTAALYPALFFFSPFGDALLSVGLYKVALKKLTTPLTRPLAFAMSYASFNLAGAFADLLVDKMRATNEDLTIDYPGLSGVYTPMRQFVVVTWGTVLLTWLIAYCFLDDWTVIDTNDEEDEVSHQQQDIDETIPESDEVEEYHDVSVANNGINMTPAKPMTKPQLLRKWFPHYYQSMHVGEEGESGQTTEGQRQLPNYKMYKTQYGTNITGNSGGLVGLYHQLLDLLRLRSTWRVLVFGFASFTIAMNWTASEMILPPFIERRFGEDVPIYTIQSINLFGCLILPPILGAITSGYEDFSIVMPGLWIMASSPIFVALVPNVIGACVWQVFMTLGEVLWSPRQLSWTASLAPTGSEGLFFAVSSARSVMGPLTDIIMGRINEKYNANCADCRDQYGHFCSQNADDGNNQCVSAQGSCDLFLESCPTTCLECPTWEYTNPSICWWLLMIASMATPVCIWLFLPFLRGNRNRDDHLYGLTSCNKNRLFGICGAMEDNERIDSTHSYGHVDGENNFASELGNRSIPSLNEDMELT